MMKHPICESFPETFGSLAVRQEVVLDARVRLDNVSTLAADVQLVHFVAVFRKRS